MLLLSYQSLKKETNIDTSSSRGLGYAKFWLRMRHAITAMEKLALQKKQTKIFKNFCCLTTTLLISKNCFSMY